MGKKKLVIFEDDAFLLDAYRLTLASNHDWEFVIFENGEQAVDKVKKEQPDLIILDLLMPGTPGLDVLKALKSNIATKPIPIIVASNLNRETVIAEALAMGANDYFIKSDITIAQLLKKGRLCLKV